MAQFARPDSTVSAGLWTEIGPNTELWQAVDEVTANDGTDFIDSGVGNNTTCELGLSNVTDPVSSVNHTIRFRMEGFGSGPPERVEVQLFDGATQIATTGVEASRAAWGTKFYDLTAAEADNIGDYTDLRVKVISSNLGAGESVIVTWVEFEVPDAGGGGDGMAQMVFLGGEDGGMLMITGS